MVVIRWVGVSSSAVIPRSLYEYYRQVDVGVGEEAPGVDVRSLDQSSARGVVQENICTLPRCYIW